MSKANYIFDVVGKKGQAMRGFLDMDTQEIVIYDDLKGRELFRIGGNGNDSYRQKTPVKTKKKLTTLTFVICNGSDTKQTATLFASNLEPLIQPLGITVAIKEIEKSVFNSHNYIRRDILTNGLDIQGMTYIVSNTQQFNNNLQFGSIKPYGVVETKSFSPLNFLGKYQVSPTMMDLSKKFRWKVDARSVLYVPVEPKSTVTLMFNVLEDTKEPYVNDKGYNYGNDYKEYKRTPISFDGNSNHIFKNINSGGLQDVNFDGGFDVGSFDSNIGSKKSSSSSGILVLGLCAIGVGLLYLNVKG